MLKLKAGIIGLGVGERHIQAYQSHPQCELVAICDFDPGKQQFMMQKYPTFRMVKDANSILDDPNIDIVSIASYDNMHYEQVVKALNNNKHVFVEKPICLYEDHARTIKALLTEKNLKLSSNLVLRISPRFLELKQMIESGQLGEIFYVEGDYNYGRLQKITGGWRGQIPGYSGVYGGGIHIVDLLTWLTGDKVIEVSAYGNNICSRDSSFKNYDMVVCILKFSSGMVGKMSVNLGCVFPHFHRLLIYGTRATFENDINCAHIYNNRNQNHRNDIDTAYKTNDRYLLLYNFLDSIVSSTRPIVSVAEVFQGMSICFAIEKAVHTGRSVKIDYI